MPSIRKLSLSCFRNLAEQQLLLGPGFNVFCGPNASGKTSILEAVYVLSTNRSFRTHNSRFLIEFHAQNFTVHCEFLDKDGLVSNLGVRRARSADDNELKLDGRPVRSSSILAQTLPIIAIDPSHFALLSGPPKQRRQLLDWLVFHVKPEFFPAWRNYQRALKQRNILLRHAKISYLDLLPWDRELLNAAVVLERLRRLVLEELVQALVFNPQTDDTDSKECLTVDIRYQSGWPKSLSEGEPTDDVDALHSFLKAEFDKDRAQGFTRYGSHKFDMRLSVEQQPAAEVLSRGQTKSFVIALYLAVARVFRFHTKGTPIFLLDDLPSELDQSRLNELWQELQRLDGQVLITGVDKSLFMAAETEAVAKRIHWFHVKHGQVSPEAEPVQGERTEAQKMN